jgi:hypothetical protein
MNGTIDFHLFFAYNRITKANKRRPPMTATPVRTCIHTLPNGVKCNGIALRDSTKCHHHHEHRRRLKRGQVARTLGTPLGRNAAIGQVVHALLTHRVDHQVARSLLYSIFVSGHVHPNDQ